MESTDTKDITLTKHAIQRGLERLSTLEKDIENFILEDIRNNWNKRTKGYHPAKWNLKTGIAKYKISEDLSVLTVIEL